MLVVVIVDYRGEQKMSFETHFFPFWERTKNVLRDTNDFNVIDSLMKTKKKSAVFGNSCLSQSRVIVDANVSDRQRRCCAPCRNIIGCKRSFTCQVLLGFCLLSCWVQFKVRSLSLFLTMILCHLAPTTRYSSQFTFQEFFLKAVFGFTQALWRFSAEPKWYLLLCWTLLWFKRHFLGILQSVDLLNMSRLKHWLTPILRYGCLQYYLNASVNSSCVRPPSPPPGCCGAFARLISPGGGVFANFVPPTGRAFANPGTNPELLTRTRFPVSITTQRILLKKQADWLICQGREKIKRFVKACSRF